MIKILLQTFWLFLPAGFANMAPVLFKWFPFFGYPVDFGIQLRGKPLFGKNKTFRGFIFGILLAILVVAIQQFLYGQGQVQTFSIINYSEINVYLLGFLLGFGALFGDIIESLFKRQAGIESGKPWPVFDQIDWVLGAIIFLSFYLSIPWIYGIVSIILFGSLHPIINLIGYYLGIKKNKF